MPGIYIHIPFCRQACHYCNFHFSVSQKRKAEFVDALLQEIVLQKNFFKPPKGKLTQLDTLYLGGGTPSLLAIDELQRIFAQIRKYFSLAEGAEITLEANPDDLDIPKLQDLKHLGVNRLSIGIQSFREQDLKYMNRSHNAGQALRILDDAMAEGFNNITADLIYGTPGMSDEDFVSNFNQLADRGIPHISAYALTVEKKTALDVFIRQGKAAPVEEDQAARQFELLCRLAAAHAYDHYEISNFGKPGHYSRHNLSYWSGEPYLGLGPSAHSFVPGIRRWNIANTNTYIDSLKINTIPFEQEVLTLDQQYNEYVMTSLRTHRGADKNLVRKKFGKEYLRYMMHAARPHLQRGVMEETESTIVISASGKFLADGIAADLFKA